MCLDRSNFVARVLVTGDSIPFGVGSTWTGPGGGDVGWRLLLQQLAAAAPSPIIMVGPKSDGAAIPDPYQDATPGIKVADLTVAGTVAARMGVYQPDIYIADAGTNDLVDGGVVTAGRISTWLDQIWSANTNASLQIMAFELLHRYDDPSFNAEVLTCNALLPGIVAGKSFTSRITLVHQYDAVSQANYVDGLHPNDAGYAQLGNFIWANGLQQALAAVKARL